MKYRIGKIHRQYMKNIYLVFLGMFGFSILGQHIVLNILHLPFSFMEIYFIPLIIMRRREVVKTIKKMRRMNYKPLFLSMLLVFGFVLGFIITQDFSLIFAYRSILYLFFAYSYVKEGCFSETAHSILLVSLCAMMGEFVYIIFFSTSRIVSSTNCIAIATAIITAFLLEKYIITGLSIAFGLILSITSGYRIGIVVVGVCVIELFLYLLFVKKNNRTGLSRLWRALFLAGAIILSILFLTNYDSLIKMVADATGMDYFAIFRVTERMRGLITGDTALAQDALRMEILRYPFERILQVYPRGLIGESIGEYWLYIDVPILYLYDLFGSIGTIAIVLWVIQKYIYNFKNYKVVKENINKQISVWLFPVIVLLFLINGTFMVNVFQAIETGLFLGILTSRTRHSI